MVLLMQKFGKLYSKLENHHPHHNHLDPHELEELSPSLQGFRSEVSKFIGQLTLELRPGSEVLSLLWIERCFGILPIINKAFAKLVVDVDYPMSEWKVDSIEGYLSYSSSLLELFNTISSSLSHLGRSRLSLSHGLSLFENSPSLARKHLKAIQPGSFNTNFGKELDPEADKERIFSGKERVVHEAVQEMKTIGFWVCGILLSGLYSDAKPYMEVRKMVGGFNSSSVFILDSKVSEQLIGKKPILNEIKDLNDSVANLLAASDPLKHDVAKELQTKLHTFEKLFDDISKEVDDLFAKVMTQRTELIDCLRLRKQSQ